MQRPASALVFSVNGAMWVHTGWCVRGRRRFHLQTQNSYNKTIFSLWKFYFWFLFILAQETRPGYLGIIHNIGLMCLLDLTHFRSSDGHSTSPVSIISRVFRGSMAPCLPFLYSSDIYWVKSLKCPRSSAQKSKIPLGVNIQVHFWKGESWTSALPCFFSPGYKIQKCHPMSHSTLLLSKQMLYNSFSGLFIYILFFFLPLSEMKKRNVAWRLR